MQGHPDVQPDLSLVATTGSTITGCVMSTRGRVVGPAGSSLDVVVPGPLAVLPAHQGQGMGAALMTETLDRARAAGWPAAFLYGNPAYYPRFGFRDASALGVTTAAGDTFPAFMGLELQPGALAGRGGRLVESGLFEVDEAAVEAFDAQFPPRRKERTATQL
ncbi:GNAT family N-acetyltransferase [Arsenicicoccus dermatophilus]|uniref:GNAT family N-acetyltransferase n=1 Tax=Arsenicicoccus dermatophilus TaxID=1076331 RepID=UPI001F4C9503|nr:N-acetyltransferase [Arsenicicoccus dermatophilus]MCH8614392.1 N-acetyltransferase [Arsenicicoccus dermatophilus]